MKKTTKTLALACIMGCCALNANARTEGNYLGINLVNYEVGVDAPESTFTYSGEHARDLSINYKYAFNFNNVILAPELEYTVGLSKTIQEAYTARINLGYDLTDNFAFLVNVGFNSNNSFDDREAITYGIAAMYRLDENFTLQAGLDMREKGDNSEITTFGISYNF